MPQFRKQIDCPSSYDLADAAQGEINGEPGLRLSAHLAACDFCAAELELYRAFPPGPSGPHDKRIADIPAPPIPRALLELAEALIAKETIHISRLEHLLREAA